MSRVVQTWPGSLGLSLLAGLTTWVTLLSWSGFAERPADYLFPLLGACLLVAVLGTGLRLLRLPVLVVVTVQVLVVLLWLHHRLSGGEGLGGWLPTPASLGAVSDTLARSSAAAQAYAAPVPAEATDFAPLLVLAGSATALLVDVLAVGFRRVPLAGLPLLAAYTAPVSIVATSVSWLTFTAAALCFLFLLAAVEGGRLVRWGRNLSATTGVGEDGVPSTGNGALWSSARTIGVTATALALVVPLLLPTFTGTLFSGGSGRSNGSGDAVSISNPMVDLRRDLTRGADVDLLTVRTADPDPSYLRITVLDSFDGGAWRPADRDIPVEQRANGKVPKAPGLDNVVQTREYASDITTSGYFRSRWLPTPYPAVAVDAPGDWRYDRSTLDFVNASDDETAAGLSYRVRSLQVRPTAAQLADATIPPSDVAESGTALPEGFPASVRTLARRVTAGQTSKFEQAVALQRWFRVEGGFRYSLEPSSGNGTDELLQFLGTGRDSRVGYCEQFAAAMAVMGRTLGIPSRVAVGFLRPQAQGDSYVYSSHDLHAWPEMFFGGAGWVRFEPTPQGRTGAVPGYTTQQVPQETASAAPSAVPSLPTDANRPDQLPDQAAATDTSTGSSFPGGRWALAALAALVVAALALTPRALRAQVRQRRRDRATGPADWVEAGWQEVRDTVRDLGLPWDDGLTLRQSAALLQGRFGTSDDPDRAGAEAARERAVTGLRRLVGHLERARYSRSLPEDAVTREVVDEDVEACVRALRAGTRGRRVTRSVWLPRSLLGSLQARPGRRRAPATRTIGAGVDRAV